MSLKSLSLSVLCAATLGGCVTEGRDFPSETVWIKANKTTKQDVQMVLKEPYSVGNSGGRATWTYGYYRYRLIGNSNEKELKFYWNPDGTVSTYSFTSNFPDEASKATAPAAPSANAKSAKSGDSTEY